MTLKKEIPDAFTDGERILVTTVQKVFNGITKFKLGPQSHSVGAIVLDDCHACIDSIQEGMKIILPKAHSAYLPILTIFSPDLKEQGGGTYADIEQGSYSAFLPVPYWAWTAQRDSVAAILAKHAKTDEIKYAWPLIKDSLQHCNCIISGESIEIEPLVPPLDLFGSYGQGKTSRLQRSATVTNDAFLVKGARP